jgi:predicted TIM-barrel fold metal-dependent hydrolase
VSAREELPWIISVDDHVVEPPHVWESWLPAKFGDRGPKIVRAPYATTWHNRRIDIAMAGTGPETDFWVYEDLVAPIPTVQACAGLPKKDFTFEPITFEAMRLGCYDPKARLADMDVNHTEASMCFPTFPRFCGQTFLEAKDKELALACVQAYNDWTVEEWAGDSHGRLIPLGLIPLWDPLLAADEVRRNAARGCRAVAFSELPGNLGLPSIHSANGHWLPFFRACEETGTIICMHIGSGSKMQGTSPDAPPGVRIALLAHNAQLSLVDWLLSGVLARFPKLRIAYSESQVGWMPYVLERVDKVFLNAYAFAEIDPAIKELPSTYFRDRVYGCVFDDDFALTPGTIEAVGLNQITFETDYPHQDGSWPDTMKMVETYAGHLSDHQLRRIMRENAKEMLGLS